MHEDIIAKLKTLVPQAWNNFKVIENHYSVNEYGKVVNSPMNVIASFKGESGKPGHDEAYYLARNYVPLFKEYSKINIDMLKQLLKNLAVYEDIFKKNEIPKEFFDSYNCFLKDLKELDILVKKDTENTIHSFFKEQVSFAPVPVVDIINNYLGVEL